ncbi:unnamed protein product [Meloidogyne enterolobii]|uniref:Uncharacterized protein n=1 Tax=Meloidogyne enterolobii TaxID=390850 RepID=A0ACB0Z626_MELEN
MIFRRFPVTLKSAPPISPFPEIKQQLELVPLSTHRPVRIGPPEIKQQLELVTYLVFPSRSRSVPQP